MLVANSLAPGGRSAHQALSDLELREGEAHAALLSKESLSAHGLSSRLAARRNLRTVLRRTTVCVPPERRRYESDKDHLNSLVGLVVSTLLHGLVVGIGVAVTPQFPNELVESRSAPFRWEVSLVSAPRPTPVETDFATTLQPSESSVAEEASHMLPEPPRLETMTAVALPAARRPTVSVGGTEPRINHQDVRQDSVPFTRGKDASASPPSVDKPRTAAIVQERTDLEEQVVLQRPQAIERDIRRITRRADYGWLADTLWAALERHKRYPSVARMNRWEGRVVVHVSVRRDGQLVNPEVEESSGYSVLDQAAVDVVQHASPLPLKYPLEQSPVLVSIPLTYHLE